MTPHMHPEGQLHTRESEGGFWTSLDVRDGSAGPAPSAEQMAREAASSEGAPPNRRAFLQLTGFSMAAAALSGCSRGPARPSMPFAVADETVIPGRRYRIATTSLADGAGNGLLATCRDGRPIKLEGNPEHPLNQGGLTASDQASLLSLYDDQRLDGAQHDGQPLSWSEADDALRARFDEVRAAGGRVRLLTGTITSPSTRVWIDRFLATFGDAQHVTADALSCSAILDAHAITHGARLLPHYRLDRATVLACFDADPLGTWISPASYSRDRAARRHPDSQSAARHWQFEARLSPTGARADRRVRLAPWETRDALAQLLRAVHEGLGLPPLAWLQSGPELRPRVTNALAALADDLVAHAGEALVLCGRNDLPCQLLVNALNHALGGEGTTLDLALPSWQRQGSDRAVAELRDDLLADRVDVLVVQGNNPAYEFPGLAEALGHAGTLVSLSPMQDETAALANFVLPEPHDLERWDDAEPLSGVLGLSQPALPPLRSTRTLRATLASWLGDARSERELLADHWHQRVFAGRPEAETLFDAALERGFLSSRGAGRPVPVAAWRPGALAVASAGVAAETSPPDGSLGLVLHPTVAMLDGRGAHNPWLQELPDPVSKVIWDNYASLSPATATRLGLSQGDVIRLAASEDSVELPVAIQPGQHDEVVAVALGYGRSGTDRFAKAGPQWFQGRDTVAEGGTVGMAVTHLLDLDQRGLGTDRRAVTITPTGRTQALACTQDHHRLEVPAHLAPPGGEVRDAVRVMSPAALVATAGAGHTATVTDAHDAHDTTADPTSHDAASGHGQSELWSESDHADDGPRWGLVVDLAACTGCSACVVSCQAENNVPVVGRDEVGRHREMSWLRIDRYYRGHDDDLDVVHQPMMCQHCAHAPCETVCPVLATVHTRSGLNAQVYNRCVGTRYCANNCPYKVRRFNWFDYPREDHLRNMALNPDVTVRSRGVMEKCSLCVQRIAEARAEAKTRGEPVEDGDIRMACEQSCPTSAIVFGDLSNPDSGVSRAAAGQRAYTVLEELNVRPGIHYLADVRDTGDPS